MCYYYPLQFFCSTKFAQAGEDTAQNGWTVVLYSSKSLLVSPSGHHKNLSKFLSPSWTLTWWNMLSISAIIATDSCQNLSRTQIRELAKSVPWRSTLLSDVPLKVDAQSKTTQSVFLCLWNTPWWGMYHNLPFSGFKSSGGTCSA